MGEIKSTLDLVMERTKHMTLSAEERREQALSELRKSLNGMIQRFLDGVIHLERLREEHGRALRESGIQEGRIFFDLVAERLDPDGENRPLLELMEEIGGVNVDCLRHLVEQHRSAVAARARFRTEALLAQLRETRGIHGTSVRPNLEADRVWAAEKEGLREECRERMAREILGLSKSMAP